MLRLIHRHVTKTYRNRYEKTYNQARIVFAIDIFLLLLAGVLIGVSLFFFTKNTTADEPLHVTLDMGSQKIVSGGDVVFAVRYENRSLKNLGATTFQVYVPHGFSTIPTNAANSFDKNLQVRLPKIGALEQGELILHGTLWAEPGTRAKFFTITRYAQGKTSYEQTRTYLATIKESILNSSLTVAATTAYPGERPSFSFKLTNQGSRTVENIVLKNSGSTQFTTPSTTLPWKTSLAAGASLIIDGSIGGLTRVGDYPLVLLASITSGEAPFIQTIASTSIRVISPDIQSAVRLKDRTMFASSHRAIPLTVTWKNNSPFSMRAAALELRTYPTTSAASLIVPLGTLSPGQTGTTPFLVRLEDVRAINASGTLLFTPFVSAQTDAIQGTRFELKGESAELPIENSLNIAAEVRYYTPEGDQLGRGPLPPRVGETTRYWISVAADASARPITNAKLTLTLAGNVRFTGKQNLSGKNALTFSSSSTQAWWEGTLDTATTTWFAEIAVTPTTEDAGNYVGILSNGTIDGTDALSQKKITATLPAINNLLDTRDRGASLGGRVSP